MSTFRLIVSAAVVAMIFGSSLQARITPTGTAFTYQGQLKQAGEPVDDTADFEFRVFDVPSGGTALAAMVPVNGLLVEQGQFTVELDFGAGIFGGDARWLEIAVRSPAGSGAFETLTPRQRIRPAPVAQYALTTDGPSVTNLNASNITTGVIANAQTSGSATNAANSLVLRDSNGDFAANAIAAASFSGSGAALTSLNASNLANGNLASARLPTGGPWSLATNLSIDSGTLVIDQANNRVGIGTTTPVSRLHVAANLGSPTIYPDGIIGVHNSADAASSMEFSTQFYSYRVGQNRAGGEEGLDDFFIRDETEEVTRFVIDAFTGNVGIGTTTPLQKIAVVGANLPAATTGGGPDGIARFQPTGSTAALDFGFLSSPAYAWIQSRDSASYATDFNLALNPNGGNVGIGTTTPAGTLDVTGAGGAYVGDGTTAKTWIGAAAGLNFIESGNTAWTASRPLHFTGFNGNDGTFVFAGNVGIGATPTDALTIVRSSGSANVKVSGPSGGIASVKLFESGDFGYEFEYDGSGATDRLRLWSRGFAGNEAVRMTWTKDGRVGIGRDPASNALEVEGGASKTTAGSFAANSDRRIKTGVRDLNDALSVIDRVRPVAFRYTPEYLAAHPLIEDVEYYNVIAQEFAQVFPDSVKDSGEKLPNGDSILQVDVHPMFIQTVAAVQQLHGIVREKDAQIEVLRRETAEQQEMIQQLMQRVAAIERRSSR